MSDVTRILSQIESGDPQAGQKLLPLVYDQLRKLAAAKMASERPDHTLNATALVHEACLRLFGDQHFDGRGHFFSAAAEAMRRILIDHARARKAAKRGGGRQRVELNSEILAVPDGDERLIALDEALERFHDVEPQKAELLKLRTFGGLSLDEAAKVLEIAPSTADRWWSYARAWLRVEINKEKSE